MSDQRPNEHAISYHEYTFTYVDEFGSIQHVNYSPNEYDNLMILLFDQLGEEWGDCKGRAWCGTCHIEIIEGEVVEEMDGEEERTLSNLPNITATSRLACQIAADENLSNITFKILKDE